ncbi:MAG TPA: helix-turn-helix transcriptional regulator, partial [Tissierellaceae bacterium]
MKSEYVGKRIKGFRKMRNLTLSELGSLINKTESTISKYESGNIIVDLETLYDISDALKVPIDQLIYIPNNQINPNEEYIPTFFQDIDIIYSYYYDGRSDELIRCVMEISNY